MKKLIIIGLLFLSACSPQSSSFWDSTYSNKVANLPDDVCVQNGVPVIYGVSTESDGNVSLIYLRNDGAVTIKHYPMNVIGTDWQEGGEFYWTGGKCETN